MSHGIIGKCASGKARWIKVGGKRSWEYKCSRCGRLKTRKPLFSFHFHQWKKDGRFRSTTLRCKICKATKQVGGK